MRKKIRWSAAIAGKTGRCKCGATVKVPKAIDPPDEDDSLLSFLETAENVAESREVAKSPSANPLQYARISPREGATGRSWEFDREIIIPLGVLVFGFAAILAWLEFHGRFVVQAIVLMVLLAGTAMVVKTIMLSLLAWYIASTSGGSFGNPLTTILKIAGLIVGLDAATLWTWTAMVAVGAITPSGQFYIGKTTRLVMEELIQPPDRRRFMSSFRRARSSAQLASISLGNFRIRTAMSLPQSQLRNPLGSSKWTCTHRNPHLFSIRLQPPRCGGTYLGRDSGRPIFLPFRSDHRGS